MSEARLLLERHGVALHRFARALAGNPDLARDLWQETAARALAARRPAGQAEGRVWLFRILRNAFLDAVRHDRVVRDHREAALALVGPAQAGGAEAVIDSLALAQALARLPDAQREVVALVDLAGFSYLEVAETLGLPKGTVMSRLSRARAAMLDDLADSRVVAFPRKSA